MKVAVVIGHKESSPGAINKSSGMSEFEFFQVVAKGIENTFSDHNMSDEIEVVYRDSLAELPKKINSLGVELVVSLHANAFNTEVDGCETLFYHKSQKGETIAGIFQEYLHNAFLNKDRGLKACSSEDRGGYLLRYTQAPCIICEPFFIDNNAEFEYAKRLLENGELVEAYCEAINDAVQFLRAG